MICIIFGDFILSRPAWRRDFRETLTILCWLALGEIERVPCFGAAISCHQVLTDLWRFQVYLAEMGFAGGPEHIHMHYVHSYGGLAAIALA
jgi:hypothetical protein